MVIQNGHLRWCLTLTEPCHCKTSGYAVVTVLAFLVAVLEFWGGGTSLSLSLIGDAWHVSSDVVVYAIAAWGNVLSMKNPVTAIPIKRKWAVRNANILLIVALVTSMVALWRITYPTEILAGRMFWVASVGLVANVLMYFILKSFRIEHEHHDCAGHDRLHDTTIWHTATDTALSMVVVVTAIGLIYFPLLAEFRIDSIASLIICAALANIAIKTKREVQAEPCGDAHSHHHH